MLTAATLYQRAVVHGNAGRHAAARRALAAARERHPDPDLAGLISGTWAYVAAESGSAPEAEAAIRECVAALADRRLRSGTRAIIASQLGLVELRRGDADAAMPHLSAAAARLVDEPARLGQVLLNRGLVHLDRSDTASALRDFGAAAEAFGTADEPVGRAKAQNNQGYTAMLTGDLVGAIRLLDASAPVLAELSPVSAAVGRVDRAEVLLAAGMVSDAIELLRDAARVYGARGLRQPQAEAELALARALAVDDPLGAARVARTAARRFRARGAEAWAVRADAAALGGELAAGRGGSARRRAAADTAERLALLRRPDEAAQLRLRLARSLLRAGRMREAEAEVAAARPRRSAGIATRLLSDEVRVELLERRRAAATARRRAAAGLDALADWQSSLGSLELHSGAAAHGAGLAFAGVRLALETGDPAEVLAWSERVRALSARVTRMRPPADPSTGAALAELRALRSADGPAPPHAAAREVELRERIRHSHWADDGAAPAQTATLDRLAAALAADDAALVAHLWTGDRLGALVIDGRGADVVDLGPTAPSMSLLDGLLADLDLSAARLGPGIRDSVDRSLRSRLRELDALLLAPLGRAAESRRLVLTPAGALAGVPWPLLPTVGLRAVALPETATSWVAARGRSSTADRGLAGLVAGPGVARAEAEIRAAALHWPRAELLAGAEATAASVADLAGRASVLHIAAHGRHTADSPLFSALELADGPWFGYDVDQLDRAPETVVLSACELGRSATRWGREALSGARAWLHAGSANVIASPAAVRDEHAEALLSAAHEHLAAGAGPADALAAAAASTGIAAPFVCHGAGW